MWHFDTEFSEIIQQTPEVKSFRFPVTISNFTYKAGQFFLITIKINGVDAEHHFSFSSSPTDVGYIEFTKRITSHEFSQVLDNIKLGTWAHIVGPFGNFTLPSQLQPLAFLTGGIGITPMRSMLRFIATKSLPYDIALLYGNKSFEEITFGRELDELANSPLSIHVEHVLSGPIFPKGWNGKKGFISKDLVIKTIPDYRERLFYVSGPPKMVLSLIEQLTAINIPEKQIKRDSFTGYE